MLMEIFSCAWKQFSIMILELVSEIFFSKSWSGGVFKSSFARFWVRVGHLNDLTSQTLLRRLDLVFTSANSPCYYWHVLPCVCDWQAKKLPNSCSGKHACTWVVCAEPLISIWKVCNSKCYFTNAITNEIFLPSENTVCKTFSINSFQTCATITNYLYLGKNPIRFGSVVRKT